MENIIYRHVYKSSKKSEYGEPSAIEVTKESNGWAVWDDTPEKGTTLISYLFNREEALEKAVKLYLELDNNNNNK